MTRGTILTRDGQAVWAGDTNQALGAALRLVPYSWDHATTWEGYGELDVPPWDAETSTQQARLARQLLKCEGHGQWAGDVLTRENCGACVLRGYGMTENGWDAPNYAGWARIYVQARRPVPEAWRAAFLSELNDENERYRDALRRDVLTYGVTFA